MSRHRFVKALNVQDEVDLFDGENAYGDEEDPEGAEQMRQATAAAQSILGDSFSVQEIQESLWHYYYDVEKTVNYLLRKRTASQEKAANQQNQQNQQQPTAAKKKAESRGGPKEPDAVPFPIADFFKDTPWLNVPEHRRSIFTIASPRPRLGLLGGASTGPPKQSKLAALAARRKKENEKLAGAIVSTSSSVALLDKLTLKAKEDQAVQAPNLDPSTTSSLPDPPVTETANTPSASTTNTAQSLSKPRKYQRKRVQEEPTPQPAANPTSPKPDDPVASGPEEDIVLPVSEPSSFAKVLLGLSSTLPSDPHEILSAFSLYPDAKLTENPFAGPSPDDVVAKAQSVSKGLKKTKAATVEDVGKQLEQAAIDKTPRAKSKNLNVVAEYERKNHKNSANFVVIGHVDSGKSTLMGRLLSDLSVVDSRTLAKYQRDSSALGKSSFALAWVMDSRAEERERGVTIDVATNTFATATTTFTILDAPGHQDFVPNMIAGASQADFAVLVLDASGNNFESGLRGQTKEHALLVRSLGVQSLVVAINKLDAIGWSRERFDEIAQQAGSFLAAAGFQAKNLAFVPLSGLQGDNVARRAASTDAAWYTGPTLLEELEARALPRSFALRGPLRMPIADVVAGDVVHPLTLYGRLVSGTVQVGDGLAVVPANDTGHVRAIDVDGEPAEYAVAGQNVALHVVSIGAEGVRAGDVVCSPAEPVKVRAEFGLKILAFEHVLPMYLSVIVGRTDTEGRVKSLVSVLDKGSGKVLKKKPKIIKPGEVARIVVAVEGERGLPLDDGARVVLRAGGETVATGLVE